MNDRPYQIHPQAHEHGPAGYVVIAGTDVDHGVVVGGVAVLRAAVNKQKSVQAFTVHDMTPEEAIADYDTVLRRFASSLVESPIDGSTQHG